MAFYDPMLVRVHVLLIDHDTKSLVETSDLLQANLYKVTAIQETSVAAMLLSNGSTEFDLVMIDVDSSNFQGFELAYNAVDMGFTVILMSPNPKQTLVKCAIEDGAFLFMQKPVAAEELKYLWPHVLRESSCKAKEKERHAQTSATAKINTASYRSRKKAVSQDKGENNVILVETNNSHNIVDRNVRSKMCTEWTAELHEKFMAAVKQLGDGRCFPKDILEVMNVPGLTRMQVASHLQKCRYGRSSSKKGSHQMKAKTSRTRTPRSKPEKFGLFPSKLLKNSHVQSNIAQDQDQTEGEAGPFDNDDMELFSMPLVETQNMKENGLLLCNDTTENNTNSMNEIPCNESMLLDDMLDMPYDLKVQSDESFDFAAIDDDVTENGRDFLELDSEPVSDEQPSYWKSLMESLTGDVGNDDTSLI